MATQSCPRCRKAIKPGQLVCPNCNMRLDPGSLQAYYDRAMRNAQVEADADPDADYEPAPAPAPRRPGFVGRSVSAPREQQPDMPLFHYDRMGFTFTVYQNRVEVVKGAVFQKPEVIPIRNISSVSTKGLSRKLCLHTNDGRTHEYQLGLDNETARQAILSLL